MCVCTAILEILNAAEADGKQINNTVCTLRITNAEIKETMQIITTWHIKAPPPIFFLVVKSLKMIRTS